ncbi:MAG: hypothetical protein GY716_24575 [bacterium]|nr:hypothetical protein [bacterium]
MRLITLLLAVLVAIAAADSMAAQRRSFGKPEEARIGSDVPGDEDSSDDDSDSDSGAGPATPTPFGESFASNPLVRPDAIVRGESLERLTWNDDLPAFAGDAPGSLTARYDSDEPAGLFGFALSGEYDESSAFTAAALFSIDPDSFDAHPNGFFQISWGLWNNSATGLNRTGNDDGPADTFELIEFDYFPNVSPFFGGPFFSPSVFGAAHPENDDFESQGAFVNFTGLFGLQLELPLGVPLLAVMEHRPEVDGVAVQVYRVLDAQRVVSLDGFVGVVPLQFLADRSYAIDAVGLTLWNDGAGFTPDAVLADLTYHALVVVPGLPGRPEDLLDVVFE